MRFKISGKQIILYRYSGQVSGRSVEARVGALQVGTVPDQIPDDLRLDLTPRELAETQAFLGEQLAAALRARVQAACAELAALGPMLGSAGMDTGQAKTVAAEAARFAASARKLSKALDMDGVSVSQTAEPQASAATEPQSSATADVHSSSRDEPPSALASGESVPPDLDSAPGAADGHSATDGAAGGGVGGHVDPGHGQA